MPISQDAYHNLERQFEAQVDKDRIHNIERVVEGWGIYLPNKEPHDQVDYIIVGMEPSFGWAKDIGDAEKQIGDGFRNWGWSEKTQSWKWPNAADPLFLFILSIEQFLCAKEETYHLTDLTKGAMPVTVAALDRESRYEDWYPLLLKEIEIVGKPGAPVIAIGRKVEEFLRKKGMEEETNRKLYSVMHYSFQASASWKTMEAQYPKLYEEFCNDVLSNLPWSNALSEAKRQLVFPYNVQFGKIRGE